MRQAVYVCTRKSCSQYNIEVMGMPTADVRLATGKAAACGQCGSVMLFRRFHADADATMESTPAAAPAELAVTVEGAWQIVIVPGEGHVSAFLTNGQQIGRRFDGSIEEWMLWAKEQRPTWPAPLVCVRWPGYTWDNLVLDTRVTQGHDKLCSCFPCRRVRLSKSKLGVVSSDQVAAGEPCVGFSVVGLAADRASRWSVDEFFRQAFASPRPLAGMEVVVAVDDGFFYFTAQTGSIDLELPKAPSNFHRYKLPKRSLAHVERAIESSTVSASGLEYPPAFLRWLSANEVRS